MADNKRWAKLNKENAVQVSDMRSILWTTMLHSITSVRAKNTPLKYSVCDSLSTIHFKLPRRFLQHVYKFCAGDFHAVGCFVYLCGQHVVTNIGQQTNDETRA